jgi:Outer membrane protein beta-barrel domain
MTKQTNKNASSVKFIFSFLLLISALATNPAKAQITTIPYSQKFAVSIKAGYSLSISSFGDKDDNELFSNQWKPGFFGAALINFPVKNNYSIQAEAGFSSRGRKIKFKDGPWINSASYQFMDVSLHLRKSYPLRWAKEIKGTWFFTVGPKLSYWLGGKGTITSGGSYKYSLKFSAPPDVPPLPDFNIMYLTNVNRGLFGIDFGIGLDAPTLALQRFIIEARFTSGFTFYGGKSSAFNRTFGYTDNLRASEKIISLSINYVLNREPKDGVKGGSTKSKGSKKPKPRKSIDSLLR